MPLWHPENPQTFQEQNPAQEPSHCSKILDRKDTSAANLYLCFLFSTKGLFCSVTEEKNHKYDREGRKDGGGRVWRG